MPDKTIQKELDAVVWQSNSKGDDKAFYELAAPAVWYSIYLAADDRNLHVKMMSPKKSSLLKQFLNDTFIKRSSVDDSRSQEILLDLSKGANHFIEQHFVEIEDAKKLVDEDSDDPKTVPMTKGEQKKWLNDYPQLKGWIFDQGYRSPRIIQDDKITLGSGPILSLGGDERRIKFESRFYCPSTKSTLYIPFIHKFSKPNDMDQELWRRRITKVIDTGNEITQKIDLDKAEQLYERKIQSASGYLIKGKECTRANIGDWLHLMPLIHKLFALGRLFTAVELKNV